MFLRQEVNPIKITIDYLPNEAEEAEYLASALRSRYKGELQAKKTADYNPNRHIYIKVSNSTIRNMYPAES